MTKPLQVFLDEPDFDRLEAWSRSRGWTKSQAVRAAIRALTRPRSEDPLLEASGMIEGLPSDLSERLDRYLDETFVAETSPRYGRSARRPSRRVRR